MGFWRDLFDFRVWSCDKCGSGISVWHSETCPHYKGSFEEWKSVESIRESIKKRDREDAVRTSE